jgi:hypothetical protein
MMSEPSSRMHEDPRPDSHDPFVYRVRVRGKSNYLWGSSLITTNLTFADPLLLHIHNNDFGQTIDFGTEAADGTQTPLGSLGAGQFVSIPLQNLRGVYATCATHSTVRCFIKAP